MARNDSQVVDAFTRDTAEDACYELQKACWAFQSAIERADTKGRIAFIAGMLDESRKRLGLVCAYAAAKELELNS